MSLGKRLSKICLRVSTGWYRHNISPKFIMDDIKSRTDDELVMLFSELRVCDSRNSTPYELVFNATIREIKKRNLLQVK